MNTRGFISKAVVRINNKYGCTVASIGKEYCPKINQRINELVRRINQLVN